MIAAALRRGRGVPAALLMPPAALAVHQVRYLLRSVPMPGTSSPRTLRGEVALIAVVLA